MSRSVTARRLALLLSFGPLALSGVAASGRPAATAPSGLTVNGLPAPADLDVPPRFGWHVPAPAQSAYQLLVSSTRAAAEAGEGDVWATGKIASSEQSGIAYGGPPLGLAQRYHWRVRTWDGRDRASPWSPVSEFGTGPGAAWSGSVPIWAAPLGESWGDYTLTARLTIAEVALGLRFRAADANNGYMWQLRGADNQLVPHRLVDGAFSVIERVALPPGTLAQGVEAEVRIEAVGASLRTFIDGVLVHALEDSQFVTGGVGVRTGNSESGLLAELRLEDVSGAPLLATSFEPGDRTFSCGGVERAALRVPRGAHCLESGRGVDWALLRRDFALPAQPIAGATLYPAAASHVPARQFVYKVYLNGRFVGLGPTHSIGAEARYDGFDVTGQLEAGENTLSVIAYTSEGQSFQAELVILYADGSRDVIGTDSGWRALTGDHIWPAAGSIGTGYYAAPREDLDAREFPTGFGEPGFDDSGWPSARLRPALGTLAAAPMAKVVEQRHPPAEIIERAPGHYFVDFGRTWLGGVTYAIEDGIDGASVELRFGEVTSAPATVRHTLHTGNTYQDRLTLRDGPQRLETWGLRVFRYLEILGAPEPVTAGNLAALALVYPLQGDARFSASDPRLEQVFELSRNSIEALNLNFYTDSWTRERTNYEADAYLQQLSSLHLTSDLSLARHSLDYFSTHRTWPTEWPLYVILAAHDAWLHSGDEVQIERSYESLASRLPEAWFEESTQLIRKAAGADGCNSRTDCDIVDWPESQRDGYVFRQYNTVVNALAQRAYSDMSAIAAALGHDEDAAAFAERAGALREGINRHLYDPAAGRYDDGMDENAERTGHHSLHASAFALAFGIPEPAEAPRVADYVVSRGMACSVYCAPFLLKGLYGAGRDEAALDLLTATSRTSWMNMIQLGAGATAEAWDPTFKPNLSFSHPWAATPAHLIPAHLFGLEPLEPGYARFRVAPRPAGLGAASIRVPTPRGTIAIALEQAPGVPLALALQVPANSTAEVSLPVADSALATLYLDQTPYPVTVSEGRASLSPIPPGCHLITTVPSSLGAAAGTLLGVCGSPEPSHHGGRADVPPFDHLSPGCGRLF